MGNAQTIINIAKAEVGYHEGRSNGHWTNWQKYSPAVPGLEWSQNQAWCAVFASWVAMKAGLASLYPRTASCATGVEWFKSRNRWSAYPAVGAQVFYGSGGGTHTGIVYAYDSTYIYTVEGNTNADGSAEGDGVYLKKRERRSSYVYGYGYPAFAEGIDSADPAWKSSKDRGDSTPFPGRQAFRLGQSHPAVTVLGKRLVAHGFGRFYSEGPDPRFTEADRKATEAFQRAQGWSGADADGYPGPSTWSRLMAPAGR
ncbi:peptidoglycan-binding protein [Streptomyces sp. NBC_00442]|uniref:peptidoglycan-binding protein n=1 Tax=Streptomyces sp. NBC_00442 TaxID=2903651 RepID=UPI002E2421E3